MVLGLGGSNSLKRVGCFLWVPFIAVLAGAVGLTPTLHARAEVPTRRVLILFPYENNFPGFVYFDSTLRSALRKSPSFQFDFYSECMDLLRFPNEKHFEHLVHLYRERYSGRQIDLIIATLGPSLDFLAKYQGEIFHGTPVLFVDLDSRLSRDSLTKVPGASVAGRLDLEGTLSLALGLHPAVRDVFVVSGASSLDRDLESLAVKAFQGFENRVGFHYLSGLPMEDLLQRVSGLPDHSLIFYLGLFQDGNGKAFLSSQALSMISQQAGVPVYGPSESYLGMGLVGGRVYSFSGLGSQTARSALRLLSGEKPQQIEALEESADQVVFDWRQLKRWGIDERRLPAGSIVRYREFSIWESYRSQILGIGSVLLLQTFLISALVISLVKQRRASQALGQTEERLRRAAEEWKSTFDSIPDLILVLDRDFRIVRFNQAVVAVLDLPPDRILGNTMDALVPEGEGPFGRALLDRALATGKPEEEEVLDAVTETWFLTSASPICNEKGEVEGFLHLARNITERKRAEAEAHRRMTELAHVTRVSTLGELAASLAHEINQPLTAIMSNAQAAQRFLSSSEPALDEVREILNDIVQDDKRVSEVIRRMRTLLKKQTVSREEFDLNEAVNECVALVSSASLLDGLTIAVVTSNDRAPVRGDRVQLHQVLFNLIVNAAGAMRNAPRLSRKLVLRTAAQEDGSVKVSVSDTGPGIDEHNVHRLFEPFYTTKPEGMGMGLSISQTIIKAHGGRMGAENNPEGGATFFFILPMGGEER